MNHSDSMEPSATAVAGKLPSTVVPVPRAIPSWDAQHEEHVQRAKKGNVGVLFLGDSITHGMVGYPEDRAVFDKHFSKYHAEAFGIGGDFTEHLLWRLKNGELQGLEPKVTVVLIGTNNMGVNNNHEIAQGVAAVLDEIHHTLPKTKIIALGILPRMRNGDHFIRHRIKKINDELQAITAERHISYMDLKDTLLTKDELLSPEVMPDFLHPSPYGYELMFAAIQPTIDELYKSQPSETKAKHSTNHR